MREVINHIESLAKSHPKLRSDLHFGPAAEQAVNQVEEVLGVKLPNSFRAYLLHFAGGMMLNYEMCGIPTQQSRIPLPPDDLGLDDAEHSAIMSIVDANERTRSYIPANYIYICSDGGDFSFFLDTAKMSRDGECPVVMYGPGAGGIQVADTFLDFLEHLAQRTSFRT